jgi:DNA-binding transcriptional ArsR family regulator
MDVVVVDVVVDHRGDCVGLADLLGLQALPLEHVQEVRVAAEVELIRPVDADPAVHEQARQHAVGDGRPDLALDVVADDREPFLGEPTLPVRLTSDEDRDRVDEPDAGLEGLLDVPLGRLFAAHREVGDHDVDPALLEDADDVRRRARRLLDDLAEVLAETVVRHPAVDRHAEVGDLLEDEGVVRLGIDGLGEVLAHLVLVDVEGGHELDVADVVPAEVDVHQAGDLLARLRVLVVVAALHEAGRAVPDADDGDADLPVGLLVAVLAVGAHVCSCNSCFRCRTMGPLPGAMAGVW